MIENLENQSQDIIQERVKRGPAGASVLRTAVTDRMGFFIFLGLATVLLP
jgi:Mg/Co/Ni transporter MgtE